MHESNKSWTTFHDMTTFMCLFSVMGAQMLKPMIDYFGLNVKNIDYLK